MDDGWSAAFRWQSSDIDWCEPNYVVTESIAEFWNTVSVHYCDALLVTLQHRLKEYVCIIVDMW